MNYADPHRRILSDAMYNLFVIAQKEMLYVKVNSGE